MEQMYKSEGICIFCNEFISQKEMDKHLAFHLKTNEKADTGKPTQTFCHIRIEASPYFLQLLVKANVTLEDLDSFLRQIWLECCGHESAFYKGINELDMDELVEDVFEPGTKLYHEYDFGSTTRVDLKALKRYQLCRKEDILLLSRNQPLEILCTSCHQRPAVDICLYCIDVDEGYYCLPCSSRHEEECKSGFDENSKLPVVNSPRMGECGYEGGMIDQRRDGVFKQRNEP